MIFGVDGHSRLAVHFVSAQCSGAAPGYSTTSSQPSLKLLTHVTVQASIDAGFWAYMRTLKSLKSLHVAVDCRDRRFFSVRHAIDLQPLGSLKHLELQDVIPSALVVRRGCKALLTLSVSCTAIDEFLSDYNKTVGRALQSPLLVEERWGQTRFYYSKGRVWKMYKGIDSDGDEAWDSMEIDRPQNLSFWSACWGG